MNLIRIGFFGLLSSSIAVPLWSGACWGDFIVGQQGLRSAEAFRQQNKRDAPNAGLVCISLV